MNTSSYSQYSSSLHKVNQQQNRVIRFPTRPGTHAQNTRGWICNISERYVFSQQHDDLLQIRTSGEHTQFDIIVKLLAANTCAVIYFDQQLSPQQLAFIRQHYCHTRTELMHAKVAFMFAKEGVSLHA